MEREMNTSEKTYVEWIYGKTGTGKTGMVADIITDKLRRHEITTYDVGFMRPIEKDTGFTLADIWPNDKILIIDNLYPEEYTLKKLLKLIDGTIIRLNMRGLIPVHPKEVYVTSLYGPEEIYPLADELLKRITKIVHL